jgi:hypothetical protein
VDVLAAVATTNALTPPCFRLPCCRAAAAAAVAFIFIIFVVATAAAAVAAPGVENYLLFTCITNKILALHP